MGVVERRVKVISTCQLIVNTRSRRATVGELAIGSLRMRCALGRSGCRALKREGDGATPLGRLSLLMVYYRADRIRRPRTRLPVRRLRRDDGWCDAAGDRNYNRHVRHPYPASAERLWREDGLYDMVVVLSHNSRPRIRARGSAIFLHVARNGFEPTEGCIAVRRADLAKLLSRLGKIASLVVRR